MSWVTCAYRVHMQHIIYTFIIYMYNVHVYYDVVTESVYLHVC